MSWPPASDYQDAIQNPLTCFHDMELKAGRVAVNKLGLPRVASGNFASVYEMLNGANRWAVRCFLRQGEDQQNRYALLSLYLSKLVVPGLVEFSYQQEGIRVRGKWYPIVKMAWVEGQTLTTYVQKNLFQPEKLRNLALQWRGLIDRLRQHKIAHADLQHGNVLVSPQAQLRLVDYDGMFVPSLRGRRSSELGHINYQHPRRTSEDYDERLDNFSALVIYTGLMALSVEPGLWKKFDTGENLLFTAQDFRQPEKSVLLTYLQRHADPGLRTLATQIANACHGTVAQVPEFRSVVDNLTHDPPAEPWWQGAKIEPPHPPTAGQTASPAPKPARSRSLDISGWEPNQIQVPPMPSRPTPSSALPAIAPPWAKPSEVEAPILSPLPEHMKPSVLPGNDATSTNEVQRTHSVGKRVSGWQSTSCVVAVLLMFGAGMMAEVVYEKVMTQVHSAEAKVAKVGSEVAALTSSPASTAKHTHSSHVKKKKSKPH